MRSDAETRAIAGVAAVISGVMLAGASGLTFVVGWTLLGVGLAVVLAAIPPAGEDRPRGRRGVRGGRGVRGRRGVRAAYAARRLGAPSASRAQRA
jgi:hypothetical protein